MNNLETTYHTEVAEYNVEWDKKLEQFNVDASSLIEDLKQRHVKELQIHEQNTNKKLFKPTKSSKSALELRLQEENLVKQQRFKEAQLIKKKADSLQRQDADNWNKEKVDKVGTNSDNLKVKQSGELKALEKKLAIQLEVLNKERDAGMKVILNRFRNKKFELEKSQKKERLLTENESLNKAKTGYLLKIQVKKAGASKVLGGSQEVQG